MKITDTHYRWTWAQVRDYYHRLADNPRGQTGESARQAERMEGLPEWMGCDKPQMLDWLSNGYSFDTVSGVPPIQAEVTRRKRQWIDDADGELDVTQLLNGEDRCYRKRSPRKRTGGIRLDVQAAFLANVRPETIAEYGSFVGDVINAIQARGADTEITVYNTVNGAYSRAYRDSSAGGQDRTDIIVSKFGQMVNMREWSALFSPGGYRHLHFTARCLAETIGTHVYGMGGSVTTGWDVAFDRETSTLSLRCDANAGSFPRAQMESKLAEVF